MKKSEQKLLQVEWDKEGERVEIHLNKEGISYLISALEGLKEKDTPDDIQLMSPDWGGEELTSDDDSGDREIVHLLKIMKW